MTVTSDKSRMLNRNIKKLFFGDLNILAVGSEEQLSGSSARPLMKREFGGDPRYREYNPEEALAMTIHLSGPWNVIIANLANQQGTSSEAIVLAALRDKYGPDLDQPAGSADADWESQVRGIGRDCGTSLTHEDVSRAALYD